MLVAGFARGCEEVWLMAFSKPSTATECAVDAQHLERKKSSRVMNAPWAGEGDPVLIPPCSAEVQILNLVS